MVHCSVISCTVQRSSSLVVEKTCRTNEDKNILYHHPASLLTDKLCLNRCPSDVNKGCCTEVK